MKPLWKQHPDFSPESIAWRMGIGEEYAVKFYKWFSDLSIEERARYIAENPEPTEWAGYYSRMPSK